MVQSDHLAKLRLAKDPKALLVVWRAFNSSYPLSELNELGPDTSIGSLLLTDLYRYAGHRKQLGQYVKYINLTFSEAWRGLREGMHSIRGLARTIRHKAPETADFDSSIVPGVYRLLTKRGFTCGAPRLRCKLIGGPCTLCEKSFPVKAIRRHALLCNDCWEETKAKWLLGEGGIVT
jgi:hypothetical protein